MDLWPAAKILSLIAAFVRSRLAGSALCGARSQLCDRVSPTPRASGCAGGDFLSGVGPGMPVHAAGARGHSRQHGIRHGACPSDLLRTETGVWKACRRGQVVSRCGFRRSPHYRNRSPTPMARACGRPLVRKICGALRSYLSGVSLGLRACLCLCLSVPPRVFACRSGREYRDVGDSESASAGPKLKSFGWAGSPSFGGAFAGLALLVSVSL